MSKQNLTETQYVKQIKSNIALASVETEIGAGVLSALYLYGSHRRAPWDLWVYRTAQNKCYTTLCLGLNPTVMLKHILDIMEVEWALARHNTF